MSCTKNQNIMILRHQQQVCKFIVNDNNRGIIVFHSVGSGKTITSLLAAKCLVNKFENKHIIILAPSSLVSNFEKEIKKLGLKFKDKIDVESYGIFLNRPKKMCKDSILIIDEIHNLNGGGITFKKILECSKKAFKVIGLSGTPVKNSPGEMAKQLSLITGLDVSSKLIDNISMISEPYLRKKAFRNFFKCKISYFKNENISDYPAVKTHLVKIKMSVKYYKEYYNIQEDIKKDIPLHLADTKNLIVFLNGVRRAVNLLSLPSPKITWVAEKIVEDLQAGKKILIYSNWIDSGINIVKTILQKTSIPFSEVTGGMRRDQKDKSIRDYNSGKNKIILVSTSGAEGLNLKETRSVIILEPHWNQTRIDQVIGRAVRFKSHSNLPQEERKVDIYQLLLLKPAPSSLIQKDIKGSADWILHNMSKEKQDLINQFYKTLESVSIEKDKSCM